jgi:predicted nucleic acid-binding Zn finger protein
MEIRNYIKKRSKEMQVIHEFSGKFHFFKVISKNKTYEVSIKANCTCEYGSIWGKPNNKVCSHVLAVLRSMLNDEHKTSKDK